VVRHTENLKDNISKVSLSDVADLGVKASDVISKGWSGGLFSAMKDALNDASVKAKSDAEAKGIDYEAELIKLQHEEL